MPLLTKTLRRILCMGRWFALVFLSATSIALLVLWRIGYVMPMNHDLGSFMVWGKTGIFICSVSYVDCEFCGKLLGDHSCSAFLPFDGLGFFFPDSKSKVAIGGIRWHTVILPGKRYSEIFQIPYWLGSSVFAFYPLGVGFFGLLRRLRRRPKGVCLKCGYDLAGLTELRCPECGTKFTKQNDAHPISCIP